MTGARLVVVEDEPGIALPLCDRLRGEGYEVTHAGDGRSGLTAARTADLVVLDLMLPGLSGSDVLRTLRDEGSRVPVICLTARTAEAVRVEHLVAGADDYVTKPFSLDELVARVGAVLRRTSDDPIERRHQVGDAWVDLDGPTVRRGDVVHELSPLEAGLLEVLLAEVGRAVSRNTLLRRVWGPYAAVSDRTIDFHVKNLRRKLEVDPAAPRHLRTVHGVGYRLDAG